MTLDRETRRMIADAVTKAIVERDRRDGERWLTADELCQQFGMITKDWLKHYGWKLPRQRIEFTGDDGERHTTRWGYAQSQIQEMFRDGRMNDL